MYSELQFEIHKEIFDWFTNGPHKFILYSFVLLTLGNIIASFLTNNTKKWFIPIIMYNLFFLLFYVQGLVLGEITLKNLEAMLYGMMFIAILISNLFNWIFILILKKNKRKL
ncbi:hypothetical protein ADL26_07440 [Thermoactinomyces vulgaris]|jgi:hypothetical protein|nr:hypothetical protein ADL26_07440 [Thermoactinomyces vulgaris]